MYDRLLFLGNRSGGGLPTEIVEAAPGSLRTHAFSRRQYWLAIAPLAAAQITGLSLAFLVWLWMGTPVTQGDPVATNASTMAFLAMLLLIGPPITLVERYLIPRKISRRPLRTAELRVLGISETGSRTILVTDGVQTFWLFLDGSRRRTLAALAIARAPPLPVFVDPRRRPPMVAPSWHPAR